MMKWARLFRRCWLNCAIFRRGCESGPKNNRAAMWKPSKAWWKARCVWFAIWRFCCGHRCWTIWVDSSLEMASAGIVEEHVDGCDASQRSSIPMNCRTSTRLASIAWCRKRCTIAHGIRMPPRSASAWNRRPDRLLLTIQDDGQGFDVQQTKGLGLLGIQERVTRLGGTCQVHSQPGAERCCRWNCRSQ